MTGITKLRTFLSIVIALIPCVQAFAVRDGKVPRFDDYPPAVVSHVMENFTAQRDALRAKGFPKDSDAFAPWKECGPGINNAHKVYLQAFKASTLSERRKLLVQAGGAPCFHYPLDKTAILDPINTDFPGDVRDAARIFVNEAVLCALQGDSDGAVTMLTAGFGFLAHLSDVPTTIIQLTRSACQGLIVEALRATLATPLFNDAQLAKLEDAVAAALRPDTLARVWLFEESLSPGDDPLAQLGYLYIMDGELQAQLISAHTAIAIERYLRVQGSLPETLDALWPHYLNTLPIDPFNGALMGYRVGESSYGVFSVGSDGVAPADPLGLSEGAQYKERTLIIIPTAKTEASRSDMPWSPLSSCDSRNSRKEKRALNLVIGAIDIRKTCGDTTTIILSAGPLNGGFAVLLDTCETDTRRRPVLAAFWVHDKQVYAVNTWASELGAELPQAPAELTLDAVRDVVH